MGITNKTVFATTSAGIEIEAWDFLVIGKGKAASVSQVQDDGTAASDFGDGDVTETITAQLVATWEVEGLEVFTGENGARDELARRHGEPRWDLYEEGEKYAESSAETLDEALQEAVDNVDGANYPGPDGNGVIAKTMWIHVEVRNKFDRLNGASERVAIDPDPPECEGGKEHDWQASHELVGGIESNPGVWGNGGGVIIKEACVRCGCGKVTDTWAQDPGDGTQGLTSVSYEEGKYAEDLDSDEPRESRDGSCYDPVIR